MASINQTLSAIIDVVNAQGDLIQTLSNQVSAEAATSVTPQITALQEQMAKVQAEIGEGDTVDALNGAEAAPAPTPAPPTDGSSTDGTATS